MATFHYLHSNTPSLQYSNTPILHYSITPLLRYSTGQDADYRRKGKCVMASGDIYVQITATSGLSGRSKSVVVLVPANAIEEYKSRLHGSKEENETIARKLADPLAGYLFTHRPTFGRFTVAHSFTTTPPLETENEPPELTRGELKAWLL
jgi:hypothetical protein